MVTNTDVAVVQRGRLWTSEAPYSAPIEPNITERLIGQGHDIAIAVEVATPIAEDVLEFLCGQRLPVDRLILLSAPGGARDNAVGSPEDACALAVGIRDAVRRAARWRPRVHLFLAGPMGLSLLLGHRWNRVAATTVYEDLATLAPLDRSLKTLVVELRGVAEPPLTKLWLQCIEITAESPKEYAERR
jgi:hypothetical protein